MLSLCVGRPPTATWICTAPLTVLHTKLLKPGASAAQRDAYESSHVTNPETGQSVHKRAAVAFMQKQAKDAKPGAARGAYAAVCDGRAPAHHRRGHERQRLCL